MDRAVRSKSGTEASARETAQGRPTSTAKSLKRIREESPGLGERDAGQSSEQADHVMTTSKKLNVLDAIPGNAKQKGARRGEFEKKSRKKLTNAISRVTKTRDEEKPKDSQYVRGLVVSQRSSMKSLDSDLKNPQAGNRAMRMVLNRILSEHFKVVKEFPSEQHDTAAAMAASNSSQLVMQAEVEVFGVTHSLLLLSPLSGEPSVSDMVMRDAGVQTQIDGMQGQPRQLSGQSATWPSEMHATEASLLPRHSKMHNDPDSPDGSPFIVDHDTGVPERGQDAATPFQYHQFQMSDGEPTRSVESLGARVHLPEEERAMLSAKVQSLENLNSNMRQRLERLESFMEPVQGSNLHVDAMAAGTSAMAHGAGYGLDLHDAALHLPFAEIGDANDVETAVHRFPNTFDQMFDIHHPMMDFWYKDVSSTSAEGGVNLTTPLPRLRLPDDMESTDTAANRSAPDYVTRAAASRYGTKEESWQSNITSSAIPTLYSSQQGVEIDDSLAKTLHRR
ncbi:hypothetical protein EKO04_011591 [Ascochyta lentis]|uniref:Uncharacterized protein n=1 Tax=Ascochyta lentis TaxID=205686 RepID=A0A8H7MD84_9PLEO|nr:hypothetical protein EKO04_011591 [Ascochyta lentis]